MGRGHSEFQTDGVGLIGANRWFVGVVCCKIRFQQDPSGQHNEPRIKGGRRHVWALECWKQNKSIVWVPHWQWWSFDGFCNSPSEEMPKALPKGRAGRSADERWGSLSTVSISPHTTIVIFCLCLPPTSPASYHYSIHRFMAQNKIKLVLYVLRLQQATNFFGQCWLL